MRSGRSPVVEQAEGSIGSVSVKRHWLYCYSLFLLQKDSPPPFEGGLTHQNLQKNLHGRVKCAPVAHRSQRVYTLWKTSPAASPLFFNIFRYFPQNAE